MILLSLGTHEQPFVRALDLVAPLAERGDDLIVQHGSTPPRVTMPNTRWMEYISFDDVVDIMSRADGVICHGGVGTIMTALRMGHAPIVIARRAHHGEHVDDHQLDIAMRFAQRGLVSCVTTETDLTPLLPTRKGDLAEQFGTGSRELRSVVHRAVAAASHRRRPAWRLS